MPELTEVKIMSDFINQNSKDKKFNKIYNVEKGNIPNLHLDGEFTIEAISSGKELLLNLKFNDKILPVYVFMGMSGNWVYRDTKTWDERKFTRLRFDDNTGMSLLLYGLYMGPKYRIGSKFTGTKRGPDPTKDFERFKENIYQNIHKKDFDKPVYETLLNQKYFSGIGNYLRSTILYYLDINPFQSARNVIQNHPKILDLCRDIPLISYEFHGGQLQDWKNPFDVDSSKFKDWVYYQKGNSIKDSSNRNFWYHPKWENFSPKKP